MESSSSGHTSDLIDSAFGKNANLYGILGLAESGRSEEISQSMIKKAYHKTALKYHPDKQQGKNGVDLEDATKMFQAVTAAFQILSDPERRSEYDATGSFGDDDFADGNVTDWLRYFRKIFRRVETEDIEAFEKTYKGSEEERADVIRYYEVTKGNLHKMLDCVMLSNEEDLPRWVEDYIKPAIAAGKVVRYDALDRTFGNLTTDGGCSDSESVGSGSDDEVEPTRPRKGKRKVSGTMNKKDKMDHRAAKKRKEAKEAEDLMAAIRGKRNGQSNILGLREKSFNDMLSGIENRYSKKAGKK
eukprot:CAMPEP_0113319934 /NCGR_PEP_ID=MMETSP0010_2-20120614/13932_1 /TAXON_ID=216773 ORGANISM="Corethron hystrix, Strain 308" /NCGR_SAMPLE_ID=MMETSP0010_2 /ASSEMBLY_ACC=CAM_ASM_000155 /LENGTH=300 /DNA_ID=CAMNT_0000177591 /DNA_START=85 /DNA_END=984 /DNA_ORIENTATION=+ /assembly_acc=CAM_ASM_000155